MKYMFDNMWQTDEMNQVYIDATVQFCPVEPTTQSGWFWLSPALCWGENRYIKSGGRHLYKNSPFSCVYREREWHNVFVSSQIIHFSVFSLSLVWEVQSSPQSPVLWTSGEQNQEVQKNILERGKKAPKAETKDSICQSSEGTRSERWIQDLSLSAFCPNWVRSSLIWLDPVCSRHEKVLEHARQNWVCVFVCGHHRNISTFKKFIFICYQF